MKMYTSQLLINVTGFICSLFRLRLHRRILIFNCRCGFDNFMKFKEIEIS